jgi:hypothetical protein
MQPCSRQRCKAPCCPSCSCVRALLASTGNQAARRDKAHIFKNRFLARCQISHKFWEECTRRLSQPHGHMWSVTPCLPPLPHHRAPLPSSHSTGRSLRLAQCASVSDMRVELRIRWCPWPSSSLWFWLLCVSFTSQAARRAPTVDTARPRPAPSAARAPPRPAPINVHMPLCNCWLHPHRRCGVPTRATAPTLLSE